MRTRTTIALILIAALAAIATLAGCGGGDSSADPQEVLDKALGGGEGVDSGVLDISLDVSSSGGQEGELSAEVEGPFQSNGSDALPSVDLDVSASIDSGSSDFELDGGLTLTADGAYVGFEDDEYQLDDATFTALKASYEQSAAQQDEQADGSLQQFGIDPRDWVTDLTNEGTEDLDGDEVVHVSGSADVPKLIADLNDVAQQTGQAAALDPADLGALEDSVTDATIDVYAATGDDSLRKLDVGLELADPRGGAGEVEVELSIAISDPGADQEISAPEGARPLNDLLSQIPGGAEALGLGAAPNAATPPSAMPEASGSAEDYYDCVATAKSTQSVEDCASLLGG